LGRRTEFAMRDHHGSMVNDMKEGRAMPMHDRRLARPHGAACDVWLWRCETQRRTHRRAGRLFKPCCRSRDSKPTWGCSGAAQPDDVPSAATSPGGPIGALPAPPKRNGGRSRRFRRTEL